MVIDAYDIDMDVQWCVTKITLSKDLYTNAPGTTGLLYSGYGR